MIKFVDIYNSVRNAIVTDYTSAYVTSTCNRVPPSFPCIWITEIDRYSPKSTITLNNNESVEYSTIEIQVFAKSLTELRGIYDLATITMRQHWYVCDTRQYAPNEDETVYRMVGRFHRIIGGADQT